MRTLGCPDWVLPPLLCYAALLSRGSNTIASVFWRLISIPHRCEAAASASMTRCACSTLAAATVRSSAT